MSELDLDLDHACESQPHEHDHPFTSNPFSRGQAYAANKHIDLISSERIKGLSRVSASCFVSITHQ